MKSASKFDKKPTVRGRPVKNIALGIEDTPERVAASLMLAAPKKNWRYQESK